MFMDTAKNSRDNNFVIPLNVIVCFWTVSSGCKEFQSWIFIEITEKVSYYLQVVIRKNVWVYFVRVGLFFKR